MNVTAYSIFCRQLEFSEYIVHDLNLIRRQTRTAGIAIGSSDLLETPMELPPNVYILP
jgi:hypothetical protein